MIRSLSFTGLVIFLVAAALGLGACGKESNRSTRAPQPKASITKGAEVGFFNHDWKEVDSGFTLPVVLKAGEVYGGYDSKSDAIAAAKTKSDGKVVAVANDWESGDFTVFRLSEDLAKEDFPAVSSSGQMRLLVLDDYVYEIALNNMHFTNAKTLADGKKMITDSVKFAPDHTFVVIEHAGGFEIVRLDQDVPKAIAIAQAENTFNGKVVAEASGENV